MIFRFGLSSVPYRTFAQDYDRRLLRGLAKQSSLAGFVVFPGRVIPILRRFAADDAPALIDYPQDLLQLRESCPALAECIQVRDRINEMKDLRPLLLELANQLEHSLGASDWRVEAPQQKPVSPETGMTFLAFALRVGKLSVHSVFVVWLDVC